MKIRSIIVDDDAFVRSDLKDTLAAFKNEIELVADFEHPLEAIDFIKHSKPDLLFLDIRMPVMNGFEMLDHLDTTQLEVIFITSFNEYAIQAIRYSALDYLLKPVKHDDLKTAIARFKEKSEKILTQARLANLKHNFNQQDLNNFQLVIPTKQGEHYFKSGEIIRCEADSNYTMIYLESGKRFLASKTLSDIEHMLGEENFLRVHKSHLVNIRHISNVSPKDEVVMNDGSLVTISRRRLTEVKDVLRRK